MKIFIISQGTDLYRNDLNEPTINWSVNYYNLE